MFYSEKLLARLSIAKPDNPPLSAVSNYLFDISAATLHLCRPSASYFRSLRKGWAMMTGTQFQN